jgi:uncharacterized membrane protein YdbT with pleckstrin-like domain
MSRVVDFEGQRVGEKVLFVFRRHMVVARRGLVLLAACVAGGIMALVIWPNNGAAFGVFVTLLVLGALMWGYTYMLWYFSVYVVSNQRLRVVMQKGLFRQKITDLGLDKVETVTVDTSGVLSSLMGYGTILIQTVVGDLTISEVSHPKSVYNKLQNAVDMSKDTDQNG